MHKTLEDEHSESYQNRAINRKSLFKYLHMQGDKILTCFFLIFITVQVLHCLTREVIYVITSPCRGKDDPCWAQVAHLNTLNEIILLKHSSILDPASNVMS